MKKRLFSIVLSLCMVPALIPQMVFAETVANITYLDASGAQQTCDNATVVTGDDTTWGTDRQTTWYVAQGDVTIDSRVTVTGDVHLILADGCNLTVNGGIYVGNEPTSMKLTIYGQENGTGKPYAYASSGSDYAGIGGNDRSGEITINGGNITAVGEEGGAGIGGGNNDAFKCITINGGTVSATGGNNGGSSGIGATDAGGTSGTITINGGTVMATGKTYGINASNYGTISTGNDGHAVIFASYTETWGSDFNYSSSQNRDSWRGVIFEGNSGQIYGDDITPSESFEIPSGKTLMIDSEKSLTIPAGKTLNIEENGVIVIAEGGTLVVQDGGTLTNNGKIYVDGTFTGIADNLYYPFSYTISPELLEGYNPIVDGKYDYNGKTYGKAGSDVMFRGLPAPGDYQVYKLVATTKDGKNTVATKSSSASISMPFASTSIHLEMITDCIINLDCNGGNLKAEGFLRVDDSDVLYCLDNKTDPLPTDITRQGYTFGGWYDNWGCHLLNSR